MFQNSRLSVKITVHIFGKDDTPKIGVILSEIFNVKHLLTTK